MNTNQFGEKHRTKATLLMRVMCLALAYAPALKAAEGDGNVTNALTVEALVAETLANNPELN